MASANSEKFPNLRPEIQDSRVLPERYAYVKFYESDNNGNVKEGKEIISLRGLNTRFSVECNIGNFYPKAEIGVCNVGAQTRDFLTNYQNFANLDYDKRVVMLYAGYNTPGSTAAPSKDVLFSGNVLYTRFTEPPDIWLNMEVLYKNVASALKIQEWTLKGEQTATVILTEAAKRLNLGAPNIKDVPKYKDSGKEMTATDFTATGDGKALLRQLRNTFPRYAIYVANNQLNAISWDRNEPAPGETVWTVREDTGLIGIPIVEYWGVDCTVLLNPAIKPGDWIKLESLHQPSASGRYKIMKLTHTGELRGKEFYTKIQAYYPNSDKSKK